MEHKPDEILASIEQFNIPGWTKLTPEQINITTIHGGYLNISLKVEKVPSESDEKDAQSSSGPASLLVKKYGGNVFSDQAKGFLNSPLIQGLICYEQSARGWGPKLYGLFENGRVEEFVDSHTLTAEEAFQPEFIQDVAKGFARFHSLKLPIKQEKFDNLAPSDTIFDLASLKKQTEEFLSSGKITDPELLDSFKRLFDFPIEAEIEWLKSLREKIKQRIVLCTMDCNYLNRLVKSEKPSDPDATRVLLIDFDTTRFTDRGYDLAGHFVNRTLSWSRKDTKKSGHPYPSKSERIQFLSAYLEEAEKLFDDFDRDSLDSLENLILEADLNALVFSAVLLIFGFFLFSMLEKEPKMGTFIDPVLVLYKELKQEFCATHHQLVAN